MRVQLLQPCAMVLVAPPVSPKSATATGIVAGESVIYDLLHGMLTPSFQCALSLTPQHCLPFS